MNDVILLMFVAVSVCLTSVAQSQDSSPVRYYVATDGNDSWSGKRPAANAGKSDGPFATVEAAQKAVRASLGGKRPEKPITVLLRGGAYRITQPLVFTARDSGTNECPITYAAYPAEKPIIDGGRRITGFRRNGKLWTVTIPEVKENRWYFSELFVNGRRMRRARLPKEGFFYVARDKAPLPDTTQKDPARDRTAFVFKSGDLQRWQRIQDAVVVLYHSWETSLLPIKSIDTEKSIVEFTGPACWPFGYFGPKRRYYVENVYEGLDSPGEWYLNRETGVLSYYPLPGQKIATTEVIAPVVTELVRFEVDAEQGTPVAHITLSGIAFQHADWTLEPQGHSDPQAACTVPAAIMMTGAQDCSLEGCEVSHVGKYAIWLRSGCKDCRLVRNHLYDLGAGGIRIGETAMPANAAAEVSRNIVDNNYIHQYGQVYAAGVGVFIGQSSDNQATHNEVCDGYYSGMSIGWDWGKTPTQAHRNLIAYNHIHHVMRKMLSDGGGIYTLGTSTGTVIRNNLIHDVFSYESPRIAWGIYLDAETNQVTVENNLCYNIQNGGLMMHNGAFENVIRNNIFARASDQLVWRAQPTGGPNVFERNLCYVTQSDLFLKDPNPDVKSKWDENLYWRTDGKELRFNDDTLAEWREKGLDRNSVVADPQFVDPGKCDFRLKHTSPALTKLGFKPFDVGECGLYGEPGWVRLPRQHHFPATVLPPTHPQPAPTIIAEDFEKSETGDSPQGAIVYLGEIAGGSIEVTDAKAASGKKSLKVTDAPGLQHDWDPHFFYQPHFTKGVARVRFKLWMGPGAIPWVEWRTGGYPYNVGPSLRVDEKDQLVANGKPLMALPREQWIEFAIVCALGKQATGTYDLKVTISGQPPKDFPQLACDAKFKSLEWLGFVSLATTTTVFYLDDIYADVRR